MFRFLLLYEMRTFPSILTALCGVFAQQSETTGQSNVINNVSSILTPLILLNFITYNIVVKNEKVKFYHFALFSSRL